MNPDCPIIWLKYKLKVQTLDSLLRPCVSLIARVVYRDNNQIATKTCLFAKNFHKIIHKSSSRWCGIHAVDGDQMVLYKTIDWIILLLFQADRNIGASTVLFANDQKPNVCAFMQISASTLWQTRWKINKQRTGECKQPAMLDIMPGNEARSFLSLSLFLSLWN